MRPMDARRIMYKPTMRPCAVHTEAMKSESGPNKPEPYLPTVAAVKAPIPMGAKRRMSATSLRMSSARL